MSIGGIAASTNLGETNNCGASLAGGASCSISINFTPTAVGNLYGTLTVTDNNNGAMAGAQVVPLAGTGLGAPAVTLSASTLSFGSQVVNSASAAQTVTLTNSGTGTLTLGVITATPPFALSGNTCGSSVVAGGICALSVTFTPTTAGPANGSISIPDNAANTPQTITLSGTGVSAPIATLSPASVAFSPPSQAVGTTSTAQNVMLANTGSAPLIIGGITASANFAETNNCGASLAGGASCSISVTFAPTAVGNLYGTLTVTDNNNGATASTQVVALAGTGLGAPTVALSASAISFGSQIVNTTSVVQTVTVTNSGTATLNIGTISATPPFAQSNTCSLPVPVGGGCIISVTFSPTTAGNLAGSVNIPDNAPNTPQTVALNGTGVAAPIATLSPVSVTFTPSQAVGTTSAAQVVTLTNTGSAALLIDGVSASTNFGETNNCGASLAATKSCNINVTFTPTAVGNLYGTLTVSDNNNGAAASTQVVPLAGVGLGAPVVLLSASTLSFGSQVVNSTSAAQTVTLTNTGTAALTFGSIAATASFAQSNTCGSSVAVGGICTISVTFTPTTAGSTVGSITIPDNAANTPQTIALSGTGVTAPIATLSPGSVTFTTSQAVGTTSAAQTVTLANAGTAPLIITGLATSANFGVTNNCGASVAVGANCSIYVTFAPTAVGNLYGTLTVTDNNNGAASTTQVVPLSGVGLGAPAVSLSAGSINFGSQIVDTTSAAQSVTVTNSGTATLNIGTITATGPFAPSNTCSLPVPVGGSCIISVTFSPTTAGSAAGSISIPDNAPNNPQTVALNGTGVAAPIATLSPVTVTFTPSQAVGTSSTAVGVTLTNAGAAALVIDGIAASANFGETNNCGASLAGTKSCNINVTFTPTAVGNLYGTLTVTDNNNGAAASTQVVPLAGVGLGAPAVSLSTSAIGFGSQLVNTTSAAQNVIVTNSGTAELTLSSINATVPFVQTNTCSAPVAVGGICTISVTFSPTTAGSALGSITLADNAGNSPQTISLTGTGTTAPTVTLAPISLTFTPAQPLGTASAPQTVTLTNTGSAPLLINNIAASGDFATTNTCGASVAAGANCGIAVTFTPTAVGNRYGTLTVTDNNNGAPGSTQTVPLEGTGLGGPLVSLTPSTLSFGSAALGTPSAPQGVTLTNSGTATITGISISITGTNSAEFSATTTCGTTLGTPPGTNSCTINVIFTPSATGLQTAALTVTDSAPNSPQVTTLQGGVPTTAYPLIPHPPRWWRGIQRASP